MCRQFHSRDRLTDGKCHVFTDSFCITYIAQGSDMIGSQGDIYNGLDSFGRVADQRWFNGTSNVDRYTYSYDRDGNIVSKTNRVGRRNRGQTYFFKSQKVTVYRPATGGGS